MRVCTKACLALSDSGAFLRITQTCAPTHDAHSLADQKSHSGQVQVLAVVQANSVVALDLDTGDINWAVQLGPLEAWTYACVGAAANSLSLNLTGVHIYL